MKPSVYIETSIPSFYYEVRTEPDHVARREWTRLWWNEHMEFRQSRWVVAVVGLGAALSAIGFVVLGKTLGLNWQVWLLGGLSVMCAFGLAEAASSFVRLDPDALRMRNNFRRHTLKIDELVEVSWAKGCPVSVKLTSGRWVQLPPLGDSSAMANSIRAWLKKAQSGR